MAADSANPALDVSALGPQRGPARGPLFITAAALVSLGALYSTAPQFKGLWLIAVLIVGSHVIRWRLPSNVLLMRTIRFVVLSGVAFWFLSQMQTRGFYRWYIKPEYTNPLGFLMAVELAIRYWEGSKPLEKAGKTLILPSPGVPGEGEIAGIAPSGPVLMISGFIFTLATNTFESRYIMLLAPAFLLCAMAGFWGFRRRAAAGAVRLRMHIVRAIYVAAWLSIGVGIVIAFQKAGQLFERITISPVWLARQAAARVGISGTPPMLGASFNAAPSPLRIMRVDGLVGDAHLRGLCFEEYKDNQWGPSVNDRKLQPASRMAIGSAARGKRYRITRWIDRLHLMYAPLNSAGLGLIGGSGAQWNPETRIVRDDGARGEYIYEAIISPAADNQGPLCGPLDAQQRRDCLKIPREIDWDVLELAQAITAGISDPRKKAEALERYLQKNYTYSLQVAGASGDRISDFVLNKRPAHCQYFASALVMMLRAVGIPSRMVTGYYAHEPEGRNAVVVRQQDAHAWTEAWIEGVGWIELDATPSGGRPDKAYPSVSFFRKSGEWLADLWTAFVDWIGGITAAKVMVAFAIAAGIIIAIQWVRVLAKRRKTKLLRGDEYAYGNADLKALAEGFELLLKNHGVPCAASCTWRQHISAVASDDSKRPAGLDFELMRDFVSDYDVARFGPAADEASVKQLRKMLEDLEHAGSFTSPGTPGEVGEAG